MIKNSSFKKGFSLFFCILFCVVLYKNAEKSYSITFSGMEANQITIDEGSFEGVFDEPELLPEGSNADIFYDTKFDMGCVKEISMYIVLKTKGISKMNSYLTYDRRLNVDLKYCMSYDGLEISEKEFDFNKYSWGEIAWQNKEGICSGDKVTVFMFHFFTTNPEEVPKKDLWTLLKNFTYTATGYL